MDFCSTCNQPGPIEDAGCIGLHAESPELSERIAAFARNGESAEIADGRFEFTYSSKEELLRKITNLTAFFRQGEVDDIRVSVRPSSGRKSLAENEVPLSQFIARLQRYDLFHIMQNRLFTSHMQPIVRLDDGAVFGYEFLLRPAGDEHPFKPFELFQAAAEAGLHSFLDREARISAIEVSAKHLPRGLKRFINFLPSSIYNPNYCLSHTFQAVERNGLDPADLVFEVVETEKIEDFPHLLSIFRVYQANGMKVALDDVGSGFNTIDVLKQLKPDYVKIDRHLVDGCDTDEAKQAKILEIQKHAADLGAFVLAEGMERREEWAFCRSAGITLAQGYLIGRPESVPLNRDRFELI